MMVVLENLDSVISGKAGFVKFCLLQWQCHFIMHGMRKPTFNITLLWWQLASRRVDFLDDHFIPRAWHYVALTRKSPIVHCKVSSIILLWVRTILEALLILGFRDVMQKKVGSNSENFNDTITLWAAHKVWNMETNFQNKTALMTAGQLAGGLPDGLFIPTPWHYTMLPKQGSH